jgi:hypothetical protein
MTLRRGLPFVFAAVLLTTIADLHAAVLAIHVHRHGTDARAAAGTVVAQSVADSSRTFAFPLTAPSISLSSGDWFLSARIDGEWSEPRLVTVRGETQTVDLDTFPLARLTAHVVLKAGKVPRELKAYFHRVSLEDATSPPEGNATCEIARGITTCGLPAGDYDLAFRIPGYVSRYRWNTTLKARTPFDAGALEFVPGSTLSGRVEIAQGTEVRLERVNVVVKPAVIPGANDEQRHRNESARLTTHPTHRGLFAFDLPPGQFTIQASYNDLISEETNVDVSAGREALLRQPLRLEPQRTITINVHPPLDPWSKPWTIQLAREDETGHLQSERSLKTSVTGVCSFNNVLPGHHRLTVARTNNQSWASQAIDVDKDAALDIDVKAIRVTGTLRLGSKPLAAMAMARSWESGASGFLRSKADGTFVAALPLPEHDTFDEIEIRSTIPLLRRTLKHVCLQRRGDGTAELNLDLPSRSISGTVVDEMNRPVSNVIVDVVLPDGVVHQIESSDGSFAVTGLEAGHYRVRAATADRESIDLQEIVLSDAEDAVADAVIPVVPLTHLRGIIRALDGPVLGAALFAARPQDHPPIILSRVDPEGHFDIRFPVGTPEVMVAINAPGFAFRLARTLLRKEEEETFAVDQNGGTLSIDAAAVQAGFRPYVLHNGAALPAIVVARVAEVRLLADPSKRVRFQIPSTEPGAYSLCWVADAGSTPSSATPPCTNGVLAPHGQLTLADDAPKSGAKSD